MNTRIYLNEWFMNAGMVGFLNILEHAKDNFTVAKDNYIEFDTKNLKNFANYYFEYFLDNYNIAKKMEARIDNSFTKIEQLLRKDATDTKDRKQIQERIKQEKKYIKDSIKKELDKIKKFDTKTYEIMLENYNKIDTIHQKEDIVQLQQIKKQLLENFYQENVNQKITLNLFKSILSKNYFGQKSFLNVACNKQSFTQQKELMYKDYISNIVEADYLQEVVVGKYTQKEILKHIEDEKHTFSKEIAPLYNKIQKQIEKGKEISEVQAYLQEKVFSECSMCGNTNNLVSDYTEGNFIPLAVSSENMTNFFWNQNVKLPICDICKLILFCIPAGTTLITKVQKEIEKGNIVYKEKENLSFVNYDTSINTLLKTNRHFKDISKKDKKQENLYTQLILDIVKENEQISLWQLQNIFVVELETEYLAYSRMEYFNIKRYVARYMTEYASKGLMKIFDYTFKLQIVDYMLKNKDINSVINERLREELKKSTTFGAYYIYLATKIRNTLNLLKKEERNMEEYIRKNNNKLYALYRTGNEIHMELKAKGEENKIDGYTHKMLNSIKTENKKEFMDIIIRLFMSRKRDVPSIFLEVMQDTNLEFSDIGHSFLAGLISEKYEKDEKESLIVEA